ncbi:UDP-N-acetyl-D-mannosamine dehydrogenase [Opitutus sp. ER46]|uniref:UDP-N-acetyl-D-mannosamine dehydrogenase n=1 Tax=Opitutus sp. ER46 TaxID=2161864 RepID=UPI0018EE56B7|nr:UDP-N-acetyl-D-mannosamine dehydrogenase [Opitutus sp. ER46]
MSADLCVLGLGYIGLPTASIFATRGKKVVGVDVVPRVVETINQGKIHIQEPELDVLVRAAVHSGNLRASLKPEAAATFIVAVPTPFKATETNPKAPDLTYVESATRSIAPVLAPGNLVILESTSPVGTTEAMRDWLFDEVQKTRPDELPALRESVLFAHCPERILPGQMLKELVSNDRISGGLTPEAAEKARDLYRLFCTGEIFLTNARTAEMCKLTENASRDVGIAFANELSLICDRLDIDVWELIRLANRHPRVKILQPGPGVGGHCIAVDPWFIVDSAPELARLIRTAREVNDDKPHRVVDRVKACAGRFKQPVIACLGLAFKADIDDLRESPAVDIVAHLAQQKVGRILAVEPHVRALPKSLEGKGVELTPLDTAVSQADIVLVLVNHREFVQFNRRKLEGKAVIDTRGLWR